MSLFSGLLNSTCNVHRLSTYSGTYDYSSSEFGEVDETWTEVYTDVPCRKDMSSTGTLRLTGGMIEAGGTTFFFNSTADIQDGDRLEHESKYWHVEDSIEVYGMNALHHLEVRVRLIDWSS